MSDNDSEPDNDDPGVSESIIGAWDFFLEGDEGLDFREYEEGILRRPNFLYLLEKAGWLPVNRRPKSLGIDYSHQLDRESAIRFIQECEIQSLELVADRFCRWEDLSHFLTDLQQVTTIETFSLEGKNAVGEAGFSEVLGSVRLGPSLRRFSLTLDQPNVDLRWNAAGDLLLRHPNLESVKLRGTERSRNPEQIEHLVEAISALRNLEEVILPMPPESANLAGALVAGYAQREHVQTLEFKIFGLQRERGLGPERDGRFDLRIGGLGETEFVESPVLMRQFFERLTPCVGFLRNLRIYGILHLSAEAVQGQRGWRQVNLLELQTMLGEYAGLTELALRAAQGEIPSAIPLFQNCNLTRVSLNTCGDLGEDEASWVPMATALLTQHSQSLRKLTIDLGPGSLSVSIASGFLEALRGHQTLKVLELLYPRQSSVGKEVKTFVQNVFLLLAQNNVLETLDITGIGIHKIGLPDPEILSRMKALKNLFLLGYHFPGSEEILPPGTAAALGVNLSIVSITSPRVLIPLPRDVADVLRRNQLLHRAKGVVEGDPPLTSAGWSRMLVKLGSNRQHEATPVYFFVRAKAQDLFTYFHNVPKKRKASA